MIDLNKYYISSTFQGASGGLQGRAGYVPQALSADGFKFLRGDGTWQVVATDLGDIPSLSGTWQSTYETVSALSAQWSQDIQTISFNEGTRILSIENGNTISLSSLNNEEFAVAMSIGLS
jgi:hypothetical protein